MSHSRGWWKLELTGVIMDDLSERDRDHIAEAILQGYIGGEICADEEDEDEYGEEEEPIDRGLLMINRDVIARIERR